MSDLEFSTVKFRLCLIPSPFCFSTVRGFVKPGLIFFIIAIFFTSFYSFAIQLPDQINEPFSGITGFHSDTSFAKSNIDKGNELLKELKYESAILFFEEAKFIYEKESLWENYFKCINLISTALREKGEIDSSITVLQINLDLAKEKLGGNNLTYAKMQNLLGYSYKINGDYDTALKYSLESLNIQLEQNAYDEAADSYYLLGTLYYNKGEFDNSIKNLNLSLKNVNQQNQKILISNIYNAMGQVYQQKGDPDKAIEYFKTSLDIKIKELGESDQELAAVYNNLAVVYFYVEDNDTALDYYLKALSINLQLREPNKIDIGIEYNNISMAYRVNGNYSEALKYGEQAKNILTEKLGERHPTVGAIINNTGRTYSDLKQYDKAIESYQTALSIWKEKYGEIHPFTSQAYYNIGEALANKGEYISAISMIEKSLSIRLSVWGGKHPKISESYQELGNIYYKLQDYDSALYFYQDAIICLAENFSNSSIYTNPDEKNILWNNEIINPLILKGDAFSTRYHISKDLNDLFSAYDSYQLSSQLIDKVRHRFKAEGSKLSFSKRSYSLYEKGINISLMLFEFTRNIEYKKAAFKFSEESKAGVLFDAVSEIKARNFSGLPDSLLEKEKDIRINLAYWETQILNEKQKKQPSPEKIKEFNDKYFSLNQQYIFLLESLGKNYPSYYQLKYKEKEISVENLQNALDNSSVIVEYFLGDTTLYIFTLSKQNLDEKTVNLDSSIGGLVKQFRQSLQNLEFENYISSSIALYKILIEPIRQIISDTKNLMIIPDGILYYLPFEDLLTEKIKKGEINFSELPYLIKRFNISYLFSTTFLQNENEKLAKYSFVGFAPVFADNNSKSDVIAKNDSTISQLKRAVEFNDKKYSELPESKKEVESILNLFNEKNFPGLNFISEDAKEEVIKSEKMNNYNFLHIATHGFINEDKPKYSGIIFTDKNNSPGEDGILYSDEIYNLNLNADLVVLSACESGLGKIVKGEGIIGLTRGFIYSGAKNIVVSLWQVADKSTSELMIEFYKNILAGRSYSSSLREAKLKLIKEGNYSYPLEWSPFVLIGR